MTNAKTSAKTVSYELGNVPKYGNLSGLVEFVNNMHLMIGTKIVDVDAYHVLKRMRKYATRIEGNGFAYPELAEECSFIITQEMIDDGEIDQCRCKYGDEEYYTAFVIRRPQFQFEIDADIERNKQLEEYQRKQFEEMKKKFEGKV